LSYSYFRKLDPVAERRFNPLEFKGNSDSARCNEKSATDAKSRGLLTRQGRRRNLVRGRFWSILGGFRAPFVAFGAVDALLTLRMVPGGPGTTPAGEPLTGRDDPTHNRWKYVMAWVYLVIAGLFEVVWAIGLKYTDGWSRLWPSLGTLAAMGVSFLFLSLAMRALPVGTAYAVWTGIGAVGTVILGIALFAEPATALRLGCVGLILAGIIGLKLAA
jgi:quaternary ammonium compound-resistance protein SugE